jgi:ABC-2 type transport system permease protein
LIAFIQPTGYRHSFPTLKDRLDFAHSFGANKAIRLFYGTPHDLLTVGGYSAWRVAGLMSIFAGMWGLLAAIRAMRGEEEAGRQELVLAGLVTRRLSYAAALAAIGAGVTILWLATFLGLVGGQLPAGGSAYLALATVSPVAVFVGIGALASQVAPTRRLALELASAALVVALLLRVVADTSASLGWLRWATPLGWAEELRPFADPRPAVLLLPALAGAALIGAAGWISLRRDVGNGLFASRDRAAPRLGLLSSPTAQALRSERASLLGWLVGIGLFALIIGMISHTFASAHLSATLRRQLAQVGASSITTPSGALGFYFLFFVLAVSLFAASQIAAARREESDQRLETLFALPVGRRSWLAGRLVLALAGAAALALIASQGGGVALFDMLGAGANCLPATVLFLSLGALAFVVMPRASGGIAYGLVSVAFVWELFAGLLGAPAWTLDLSPFHHVGLVPAQSFRAGAGAAMVGLAAITVTVALWTFRRRDLTGA